MNRFAVFVLGLCVALTAFDALASISTPNVQLELTINDPHPAQFQSFGIALNKFDDNLLVGSYGGSVYKVDPSTGNVLIQLQEPETSPSYGEAVSQFGNLVAVGAHQHLVGPHVSVGSVFLHDGTTGSHIRTLRNPTPATFTYFGSSLASVANKLFVGSEALSSSWPGKVYIYGQSSATPIGALVNPQANVPTTYGFGTRLLEHAGDLFVSAPGARTGAIRSGAVYRYDGVSNLLELTIPDPSPQHDAFFGNAISTRANHILVGAPGRNVAGVTSAGGASLFDATTGTLLQSFVCPLPQEYGLFGASVALIGRYAVIGMPFYSPTLGQYPSFTGAAFMFDVVTGDLVAQIDNPTPGQNEYFPEGSTNMLEIGGKLAIGHGSNQFRVGAVYMYSVPEPSSWLMMTAGLAAAALRRIC
jgi:hypothetical protein